MSETIFYILIATIIALAIAIILMSVYYTEKLEKEIWSILLKLKA